MNFILNKMKSNEKFRSSKVLIDSISDKKKCSSYQINRIQLLGIIQINRIQLGILLIN